MVEKEEQRLLTVAQAARLLGIADSTVRRWADQGLIPHVKTLKGYRRFELDVITALAEEMKDGAEPPTKKSRRQDDA